MIEKLKNRKEHLKLELKAKRRMLEDIFDYSFGFGYNIGGKIQIESEIEFINALLKEYGEVGERK